MSRSVRNAISLLRDLQVALKYPEQRAHRARSDKFTGRGIGIPPGRVPELAAHPQAPLEVASIERLRDPPDHAAATLRVREPGRLPLAAEAGHHDRLGAAVLLDPVLAVAKADPGLLPAAHRHVHRQVVD